METILILGCSHELMTLTSQSGIVGSVLPILTGQGSLGVDGVSHIQTWLIELLAIATTLLIESDGFVQILIDLCISLGLSRKGLLAQTLIHTQHDTTGVTLMVAPAIGIELCQTEERVSTEGKSLCLQESTVALGTLSVIDIADNSIGITNQLIIVEPRINGVR